MELSNEPNKDLALDSKACTNCKEIKSYSEFYKSSANKDGKHAWCKGCIKKCQAGETMFNREEKREKKGEILKKMAHLKLDNPDMSLQEISKAVGISEKRAKWYWYQSDILRALRGEGYNHMRRLIPNAVKSFSDLVKGGRDDIRYKASRDILEDEGIIGHKRIEIGVETFSGESTEKLQAAIRAAKMIPDQTIMDAEVVGE